MSSFDDQWLLSPSGSRALPKIGEDRITFYESDTWPLGEDGDNDFYRFQQGGNYDGNYNEGVLMPEDDVYAFIGQGEAYASELRHGEVMNSKIPPAYDGKANWFKYEELVQDWQDSCVLEAKLRGPALKNRLYSDCLLYTSPSPRD